MVVVGTKPDEYLLEVDSATNTMRKIQFDEKRITVAQNTVKFARIFRAKNENLHAAVQQKYQECISNV